MKVPDITFQFDCVACGKCCRRPGFVAFTSEELQIVAEHLGTTLAELIEAYGLEVDDDGFSAAVTQQRPCPFLRDEMCSIHAVKPSQCRTYPFWPELLIDAATWQAEARHCPGIGQGRIFSRREARALMRGQGRTDAS